MHRIALKLATAFAFLPAIGATGAEELPRARPADVGLSADAIGRITPALVALAEGGKAAGGVALVARHGKVVYFEPFGVRDLATRDPMTIDTIFAVASMTKPVTCVAAMTLIERGKMGLDDPVGKYLPELKGLKVLGDPKDDDGDEVATVPAKRPVTVRDLLAHSSGIAYGGLLATDPRLGRVYAKAGVQGPGLKTVAEQVTRLAKVPLAHQPGEGWTYGLSHDVLGRVVEVVSGQGLDVYLQETVFRPLDMIDTAFLVPESKRNRVATIYRSGVRGTLTPLPKSYGSATLLSGGGGLFSTARDYARFALMLLNGGELNGSRVLQPESVRLMTTNQIGDRNALVLFKYGLGFGLEAGAGSAGGKPVPGRYFWGGIFSTYFWVDPRHDLLGVVLTQVVPTNSSGVERAFRRAVDAAITD